MQAQGLREPGVCQVQNTYPPRPFTQQEKLQVAQRLTRLFRLYMEQNQQEKVP